MNDAIIVLGGGIRSDGTLFPKAVSRVEKSIELFNQDNNSTIIMSGGFSWRREYEPEKTEAAAMRDLAISLGVPEDHVHTEEHSRDTFGNLFFTKLEHLIPNNWKSITVVTSDYHVARVEYVCQKIFGEEFTCKVCGTKTLFSDGERQEKLKSERRKIDFVKKHLADLPNGNDEEFRKIILVHHPGYNDDPIIKR